MLGVVREFDDVVLIVIGEQQMSVRTASHAPNMLSRAHCHRVADIIRIIFLISGKFTRIMKTLTAAVRAGFRTDRQYISGVNARGAQAVPGFQLRHGAIEPASDHFKRVAAADFVLSAGVAG
jgi:hypothetical protein